MRIQSQAATDGGLETDRFTAGEQRGYYIVQKRTATSAAGVAEKSQKEYMHVQNHLLLYKENM